MVKSSKRDFGVMLLGEPTGKPRLSGASPYRAGDNADRNCVEIRIATVHLDPANSTEAAGSSSMRNYSLLITL
jgi:hypothetical protein